MTQSPRNSVSRRRFIHLAGLVAAGAAVSACAPVTTHLLEQFLSSDRPHPSAVPGDPAFFTALNRLTFGPRAQELDQAATIGLEGWIEQQLSPDEIDDLPVDLLLRRFGTLNLDSDQLADLSDKLIDDVDRVSVPAELQQATLIRQVYSRRQLVELMVDFWSDHFNISIEKGDCFFLKTVDDREVIRKNALGSFRDLLWASAHSPAMLIYLDNQSNQKGAPNENYARELLELHTLGVNGGYTQHDVMEMARCLTGWTVKDHFWRGRFTFKNEQHDPGTKTVLGLSILPAGKSEGEQVIEHLANHPGTAHFISRKLARRFISNAPSETLVDQTARVFIQTNGDIREVMRSLILNGLPEMEPKIKRPSHFIASSMRMLDVYTDSGRAVQDFLERMGQPYFRWPTPDGYPDRDDAWQNNLVPRWQFAIALAQNMIPGTKLKPPAISEITTPAGLLDHYSHLLLGAPIHPAKRDPILNSLLETGADGKELESVVIAGLLASPAFQYR